MTAENVVAKAKREAVVILGMHRSGTSALGGVLTRLGAQAPRTLMVPTKDNPRGYSESLELLKVHESILRSAGSRWNDWGPVNPDWLDTPTAEQFQLRLVETLQKEFGDAPLFLIKDPRACLFFPLWRRALKSAGVVPKVVFQLRHPLEVAQSLEARDHFSRTRSLLLWLRYVLEGERGSRKLPRAFVHYHDLLGNWQATVQRVGKALGVRWPKYSGDTVFAIEEFLSSELRHHAFQDDEVAAVQPLAGWVSEAYAALNQLALPDATKASAQSTLDRIRAEFDAGAGVYAAVVREHETRVEDRYASVKKQLAERTEESNDLSARLQQAAKERDTGRVAHEKQAVELSALADRLRAREAEMGTMHAQHAQQLAALNVELEARVRGLHTVRAELESRNTESKEQARRLEEAQHGLAALEAERKSLRAELESRNTESKEQARRLEEAQHGLAALEAERENLRADLQRERGERNAERSRFASLQEEAARESDQRSRALDAARREVAQTQTTLEERFAEIAKLTTLLLEQEGMARRGNALLEQALVALRNERGRLHDQVEAAEASVRAYQHVLREVITSRVWRWTAFLRPGGAVPVEGLAPIDFSDGLDEQVALVGQSGLFDGDWYRSHCTETFAESLDPVRHYLLEGAFRGLDPGPGFSTLGYLLRYPDVRADGVNSLVHYLQHGMQEGRSPAAPGASA